MRLIDADAFEIELQHEWGNNNISNGEWMDIRQWLDEAPTIDAEPVRHGKWEVHEAFGYMDMTCSVCGWLYEYYLGLEEKWNFCPHCGAKMDLNEVEK